MSTLPAGYLSKKGARWRPVRLLDIVALLANVYRGETDPEVGFEDALETLDTLTRKLNKCVFIDPAVLESALWSCNLMDEKGQFWHPTGMTFDEFTRKVLRGDRFNKVYNVIEKVKEE